MKTKIHLLHEDLTYKIRGALFDVHNQLGGNHPEKYYQKAVAVALKKKGLHFEEQYYTPLKMDDVLIGKYYLDFLIEKTIVLELKRGRYIPRNVYAQAKKYLSALHLELAIVACFSTDCVVIKRIVQLH